MGANYYVDCNAAAGGDGSLATPWDAVADVNAASFSAGDYILFNRGCTWTAKLAVPSSGSSGNPITFGAYGSGAKPILSVTGDYGIYNNQTHITFSNLDIRANSIAVVINPNFQHVSGITIDSCSITATNGSSGIYILPVNFNISSVIINNNNITAANHGIELDASDGVDIYDFEITNNTIHDITAGGIFIYGAEVGTGEAGKSPYGFNISYNTLTDVRTYGIMINCGLKDVENHPNYIGYNNLTRIGYATNPNINGMQLCWINNTIIEHNSIDTVATSVPDGNGIILDFAWSNDTYYSDNNTVRFNTITGCLKQDQSCGIMVFKAKNSLIHNNISHGNGCGIGNENALSTDNVFYNNTLAGNAIGIWIGPNCPATTWINNISSGNTLNSITKDGITTPTAPTETYNVLYGLLSTDTSMPPILTGLVAYYDGDYSTITETGAGISQWNDLSGNNNHLLQTSDADRPSKSTIGTHTSVLFDRANSEFMEFTTPLDLGVVSMFAVVQVEDTATMRAIIGHNTGAFIARITDIEKLGAVKDNQADIGTATAAVTASTPQIVGVTYNETGGATVFYKGVTTNGTATNAQAISVNTERVGTSASGNLFDGHIISLLIYNSVLSQADSITVLKWLNRRFTSAGYTPHATDIKTNPLLTATYHLQAGSPAIAAGIPWQTYAEYWAAGGDKDGKGPTNGTFSMGAFQFQKQTSDFPALPIWSGRLKASKSTDAGSYVQP